MTRKEGQEKRKRERNNVKKCWRKKKEKKKKLEKEQEKDCDKINDDGGEGTIKEIVNGIMTISK